jgi:hypothetical protein
MARRKKRQAAHCKYGKVTRGRRAGQCRKHRKHRKR